MPVESGTPITVPFAALLRWRKYTQLTPGKPGLAPEQAAKCPDKYCCVAYLYSEQTPLALTGHYISHDSYHRQSSFRVASIGYVKSLILPDE